MRIREALSGEEGLPVLAVAEVAFQPPPISTNDYTSFEQEDLAGYENDLVPRRLLVALKNGIRKIRELSIGECTERNNLLYYRDRLYIPDDPELRLQVMKKYHDSTSAGHPGRYETFYVISRALFWPNMREHISQYMCNCQSCMLAKPSTHGKYGFLHPLPIPNQPWQEVSMDFVTGLPISEGYHTIMVVVDSLTKMRHLIACHTTINASKVARLYLQNVWKPHGIPMYVTSDRGTQFTAQFWQALVRHPKMKGRMSMP